MRHRYHIPTLSDLEPKKPFSELTAIGEKWQKAGFGSMFIGEGDGKRWVSFALNDEARDYVDRLNRRSFWGRVRSVSRSDWISLGALIVSFLALLVAAYPIFAQNPAMTPRPLADWPGAEIAEGVAFQGDGSVTLEASEETGLPVVAFWRPVLHDEDSRYPVAGRMDCRIAASEGPFDEADFDPEARHEAVVEARRAKGFIDMERLASGDDIVKQLDVTGRRNSPRSYYVLSYIMARDGARLIDIRRNCTFVFGAAASKPDVLPFVNRYTKLTFAFSEQDT